MDDVIKNIFQQLNDLRARIERLEADLGQYTHLEPGEPDPKLPEAIKIVQEYDRVSASLLQRRLSIGYARAARMVDQMEEKGIVSAGEGSKPRKVLKKG